MSKNNNINQITTKLNELNKLNKFVEMSKKYYIGKFKPNFDVIEKEKWTGKADNSIKKYQVFRVTNQGCNKAIDFDLTHETGYIWVARTELKTEIGEEVTRAITRIKYSELLEAWESDKFTPEDFSYLLEDLFELDNLSNDTFYEIFKEEIENSFEK